MGYGIGVNNSAHLARRFALRPSNGFTGRTVFSGDRLSHVFAQQNQPYGRNAKGTAWFEGDTLYSYGEHYPMARIVPATRSRDAYVLINAERSSITTERHKRAAIHATKHLTQYLVKNVVDDSIQAREQNIATFVDAAKLCLKTAHNTRYSEQRRLRNINGAIKHATAARKLQHIYFPRRKKAPIVLDHAALDALSIKLESAKNLKELKKTIRAYQHTKTLQSRKTMALAVIRAHEACSGSDQDIGHLAMIAERCDAAIERLSACRCRYTYEDSSGHHVMTAQHLPDYAPVTRTYAESIKSTRTNRWRTEKGYRVFDKYANKMRSSAERETACRRRYEAQRDASQERAT